MVTIAIPAYKSCFLSDAIESALAQSYADIEVLIVDDCSPEDIKSIVNKFHDDRLRYYRNEKNLGKDDPSMNWNRCLELAHGEHISILCDDDIYHPDFVAEMVSLADRHSTCNAFRAGVQQIDSSGRITDYYPLAPEHECIEEYIWHLHSGNNRQTLSEWMFRKTPLIEIGGYANAPMAWGADCVTVYRLARNGGVVSSPKRLMNFRKSNENITGREYSYIRQKIEGWRQQCELAKDIIMAGNHEAKEMIIKVVLRDERRWTKFLSRHASFSELLYMYKCHEHYGLDFGMLMVGIWKNITHPFRKRK